MNAFYIKLGDRLPIVQAQLSDAYGPINLSGATVSFLFRLKPTGTLNSGVATIISGDSGVIQYAWSDTDSTTQGVYWAEFKTVYGDGKTITFPNDSYLTFEIVDNLP